MIKSLEIQNYAIIDAIEIGFSDGLNIVTGETGAGKSILLGALGLIMGNRADTKVLYDNSKKCFVEGVFDIKSYNLKSYIEECDLDYSDDLVIRREIAASGKSRAFVNDTPVRLNILQELSNQLVDLHQQFDTLDIHNVSFQMKTLDTLAGNQNLIEKYRVEYHKFIQVNKELAEVNEQRIQAAKEQDFIQFQMNEFNDVELEEGEQIKQEQQLNKLSSTEELKRIGSTINAKVFEDEYALINQLQELLNEAESIRDVDQETGILYERFYSIVEELKDLATGYQNLADQTDHNPELLQEIEARLDTIYKLQQKHHVNTVEELIEIQNGLSDKLSGFKDLDKQIADLELRSEQLEAELNSLAQNLSKARKKVAPELEENVKTELEKLGMEHARLKIEIEPSKELKSSGKDDIRFLFASNKGSSYLPLKDVASGGELSRLTLVLKSLVAGAIALPTLIFDEIDTGVSGEVASKMGGIIKKLGTKHQVISITHSPQIASRADKHFYIFKEDKEERTITKMRVLEKADRIVEVAKMLSGDPPSKAAINNAKELLQAKH